MTSREGHGDDEAAAPPAWRVVTVIAAAALGIGLIFLLAAVVGVVDAVRAPSWRRVAAERRERWETGRDAEPQASRRLQTAAGR
jgi:hypothetical protein